MVNQLVYSVKITVKVAAAIIKAVKATIEAVDVIKIRIKWWQNCRNDQSGASKSCNGTRTSTQGEPVQKRESLPASHRTAKLAVKGKIISKIPRKSKKSNQNGALSFGSK